MNTPIFPAWRSKLAAYGRKRRIYRSAAEVENEFSRFVGPNILDATAGSRQRIFTIARTFWCFLWQSVQAGTSCRSVVRKVQAEQERQKIVIDSNSSAYCQARARVPLKLIETALYQTAKAADSIARCVSINWKRRVLAVDATSFQMPDTLKNRRRYHYPTGQKKGCGFPVARALAIFSLASGAIHQIVTARCYAGELAMLKPLWSFFLPGDILLGDRIYGCFSVLSAFSRRGVDVVARLHQGYKIKLKQKQRIGVNDWKTQFRKAAHPPPYMSRREWADLPEQIEVRIVRASISVKGFRTRTVWIVTTLLDATRYTTEAITELYYQRWQMELSFRDLKTTMGMEMLRCQTPAMIEKEIRIGLVAYNCIRALMAEAAISHNLLPKRISFKGTIDSIRSFYPVMFNASSSRQLHRLRSRLLEILADDALPDRPDRSEPRAVKRRKKPYSVLTSHRRTFHEVPHRGKYKSHRRKQVTLT
jgi:Transposase DDE domain